MKEDFALLHDLRGIGANSGIREHAVRSHGKRL